MTRTVHPSERKIWMVPELFAADDSNLDSSQVLVLSRGGQQWILQAQEVAITNGSKDTVWYRCGTHILLKTWCQTENMLGLDGCTWLVHMRSYSYLNMPERTTTLTTLQRWKAEKTKGY